MARIPRKLKTDPISEGLLEIRFACQDVPEVIVGRLASSPLWVGGVTTRLPSADIPAPIRNLDPNLKFVPTLEIRPTTGGRLVRIGEHSISYHTLKPYPGWGIYSVELTKAVSAVFACGFTGFKIERLGFRYINSMREQEHGIHGVDDLNVSVEISGTRVQPPLNINYGREHTPEHKSLVRLASSEFVLSPGGEPRPSAVVDIDIFTPDNTSPNTEAGVGAWVETAHTLLKGEFFGLFTKKMFDDLVEQW
jgi:uncharacterized protein (TIGR04255 family)